jgi:hypothetical protein
MDHYVETCEVLYDYRFRGFILELFYCRVIGPPHQVPNTNTHTYTVLHIHNMRTLTVAILGQKLGKFKLT